MTLLVKLAMHLIELAIIFAAESYEVVTKDEYLQLLEEGWDVGDFIPVVNGHVEEDEDDESVFYDQSEVAYYIMTKPRDTNITAKGSELPWYYLTLLIASSTFYASATNCPAHWFVLFWLFVSLFTCVTH